MKNFLCLMFAVLSFIATSSMAVAHSGHGEASGLLHDLAHATWAASGIVFLVVCMVLVKKYFFKK